PLTQPLRASMRLPAHNQTIQQHRGDTDTDRAVGEIEGGPVQRPYVKVKEIDDCAKTQSVDDIAHSAADDQPDRDCEEGALGAAQPQDQERYDYRGCDREDERIEPDPATEQTKADPPIEG